MRCCQTLPDQRNRRVLRLVQDQRANKAAGLVHAIDLDFNVALHVSARGKLERLLAVRLALLAGVACSARRADTTEDQGERLVVFRQEYPGIHMSEKRKEAANSPYLKREPDATYSTTAGTRPKRLKPLTY